MTASQAVIPDLIRDRPSLLGEVDSAFAGMTLLLRPPRRRLSPSPAARSRSAMGLEPIPNGMVVVRNGRIVAAGDIRMKLPAGTQVIDATGKWVTPGIVGGFTRLGLAEIDLSAEGSDDTTANGPFSAALDVVDGDQSAVRADCGQPRRRSHARARRAQRRQEHFRRPGRGDRHRRRHGPDHPAARVPVRRARRNGQGQGGRVARVGARAVPQCAARGGASSGAMLRPIEANRRRHSGRARAAGRPQSRTNRASTDPTRAAARTCC